MNTEFKTEVLGNGLTVKVLGNEHLHSVNIGIYIKKPTESVRGIAHLTEHMFFRRLNDLSQQRLYFETDRIGATLRASTYVDFLAFDITAPPDKFSEAFNLIIRMFGDFEWTSREIAAEKEVVRRQIEERYWSMYDRAEKEYFSGTPMGEPIMGTLSDIHKMSAKKVNEYRKALMSPENCCLVLTGNFTESDYLRCLDVLKDIPARAPKIFSAPTAVTKFAERNNGSDKIYTAKDEYSDVCISFDTDVRKVNRYAAEILHSILGYGVTSKLSQKLREEMGLITEMYGGVEFSKYGGRMTFEFEVNNTCLKEALIAAFDIILHTRGGFSQSDLDANKLFYTDNQYRLLDDPGELNFLIGKRDFIDDEILSLDELTSFYAEVDLDEINRTSNEIFRPENLIISVSNGENGIEKNECRKLLRNCREEL